MAIIDGLRNVSADGTVRGSTQTLIGKIAGTILDNLHKPDELKRFAEELLATSAQVTDAVTAGTVAEEEAEPEAEVDGKTAKRRKRDE